MRSTPTHLQRNASSVRQSDGMTRVWIIKIIANSRGGRHFLSKAVSLLYVYCLISLCVWFKHIDFSLTLEEMRPFIVLYPPAISLARPPTLLQHANGRRLLRYRHQSGGSVRNPRAREVNWWPLKARSVWAGWVVRASIRKSRKKKTVCWSIVSSLSALWSFVPSLSALIIFRESLYSSFSVIIFFHIFSWMFYSFTFLNCPLLRLMHNGPFLFNCRIRWPYLCKQTRHCRGFSCVLVFPIFCSESGI